MTPILSVVVSSTLLPRLKSTNGFAFVMPAAISLSRLRKNHRPLSQFWIQRRKCCLLSFILLCSDQRGRRTADGFAAQVMSVFDNVTSFLFLLLESFEFTDNQSDSLIMKIKTHMQSFSGPRCPVSALLSFLVSYFLLSHHKITKQKNSFLHAECKQTQNTNSG